MFDPKTATIEELTQFADDFSHAAKMTHLYTQEWIPNAKTAEEAKLYAQAVEYILDKLDISTKSWEVLFTEAYKDGKSVEAFKKLVEFGLLDYPV